MFRDVRYFGLARRLAQEGEMNSASRAIFISAFFCAAILAAFLAPAARAGNLTIPPEAQHVLDTIYSGNPDAAIPLARKIEQAHPDDPLGFLLEGEALWWKRYCAACDVKYGFIDSWKHGKDPGDEAYLALTDHVIHLAEAQLAKSDTPRMRVYAGFGYALKARLYSVRGENRNVAHAGVNGRAQMLRALELDPQMADATAGVGIYNYYVDSLPTIVKVLRFFMGIPGGDKQKGVEQMEVGMNQGVLLAVDVRFILARALRQYDEKYEEALNIALPLAARYPQNALFQLLLGNLNTELGRKPKAAEYFRAALAASSPDPACAARIRDIANSFLK
jgi:tetratricopeptide (TPR) repeat protein